MIFSLDFSKLKMVEVSSFVLLSEIEDKIRELDGRNNSIWATLFSIFPNWSVFLVLVPVMSSCWGFELIEPEAWPRNSHGFLILPKVHLYLALWECSCPMCSERPPFMEAVFQNWQLSPFGFSGGGTLGFGGGALPSFCNRSTCPLPPKTCLTQSSLRYSALFLVHELRGFKICETDRWRRSEQAESMGSGGGIFFLGYVLIVMVLS